MGAYNVVNRAQLATGQPEDISFVVANLDAIAAVINGGLDNTNLNAAAAIVLSKLAGYPSDVTKVPRGDGTWGVPSGALVAPIGSRTITVSTSGTTFGTGADLLAAALSFTADGTSDYIVEFSAASTYNITASATNNFALNLDGADQGNIATIQQPAGSASTSMPVGVQRVKIAAPVAGAHTVNVRLYVGAGTGNVEAGAGGAGNRQPILVSVKKA